MIVLGVSTDDEHRFSKVPRDVVTLVEDHGVLGDAHAGASVQHRSRVARDATAPNLRQVHLVHAELFDEARAQGYDLAQGDLGENILTSGVDLLDLPTGTRLLLGDDAIVRVTGLRNPCRQIDAFRSGLLKVTVGRDATGGVVRKAGVMSVVERGGDVRPGDGIGVELPDGPFRRLEPV